MTKNSGKRDDPFKSWTPARRRALEQRAATVPFPNWLGIDLKRISAGEAELSLTIRKKHHQYQGLAHGGVIAALADTAATFAALSIIPDGMDVVTIEFKVNFLAPAKSGRVGAHGSVVKIGRRVTVAEVDVFGKSRADLLARGIFTMLNFPTTATSLPS